MVYHEVKRGECLWCLAHKYLGNGTRWSEIHTTHNAEAAKLHQHPPLMPITNENLIYVGQTIAIPVRKKTPQAGDGKKAEGGKLSRPLDLKVTYTIGRDTPPIEYIQSLADHTIITKLSGDISLEITSDHMRRHSIELALSKNSLQAKQKLYHAYDPAVCALTAKPTMVYESGRVKIKAPICTAANAGDFTINVQAKTPNHMSGTIRPPTLNGVVNVNKTNYKFSANISLSADVTWHPKPKGQQEAPVRDRKPGPLREQARASDHGVDWSKAIDYADEFLGLVTLTIISVYIPTIRTWMTTSGSTTSMLPFTHTIDRRRHGYPGDA